TSPLGANFTIERGCEFSHRPVIEVERLFIDSIRSARKLIYIDNQYFSSTLLAKALARRLREANGPEIVLIMPRNETGLLETLTHGFLRARNLNRLRRADTYGRF